MAVKVLIKRKFKEGSARDGVQLILQARSNAIGQPGYISSETLSGCDDPNQITVVTMWQNANDWENYKNSEVRVQHETRFEPLLDAPPEYEKYLLGLPV